MAKVPSYSASADIFAGLTRAERDALHSALAALTVLRLRWRFGFNRLPNESR